MAKKKDSKVIPLRQPEPPPPPVEVSFEEFLTKVQVLGTPIESVPHIHGGLAEGSTFWLHTSGMGQFGRPEMEITNIPGAYLGDAAHRLNKWAHYSIAKPIQAGEKLREGDSPFHPVYEMVASPDDFWEGKQCLRLQLGAVLFQCAACGGHP